MASSWCESRLGQPPRSASQGCQSSLRLCCSKSASNFLSNIFTSFVVVVGLVDLVLCLKQPKYHWMAVGGRGAFSNFFFWVEEVGLRLLWALQFASDIIGVESYFGNFFGGHFGWIKKKLKEANETVAGVSWTPGCWEEEFLALVSGDANLLLQLQCLVNIVPIHICHVGWDQSVQYPSFWLHFDFPALSCIQDISFLWWLESRW